MGTEEQWEAIEKPQNTSVFKRDATIHFLGKEPGDIDRKKGKDTEDAVYLLLAVLFGTDTYPVGDTNLDFDSNGKVNTGDAVYLLLHVLFGAEKYPLYPEAWEPI